MQIVEVHAVFHCSNAVLVGRAVGHASLHTAAGHPETEAGGVVVAPVVLLDVWRAAKLAAPDDEGLVEQSAFLEVAQQGGQRLVGGGAVASERGVEVAMLIPVAVRHLDEPDAGLGEATRHQALASEILGGAVADAVILERGLAFIADLH